MPSGAGSEAAADRFVAACREVIRREIPGLVEELFLKLDDALYDLADKSGSNRLDAAYFDAMGIFRRRRREILSLFLANLLEDGDNAATATAPAYPASASGTPDTNGVAPTGGVELEETLAVTNLISKAENRYHIELIELRRHLASLRGEERIDNHTDPLGPHRLCMAFRQALSPVDDVELAIKLIVYKLFDKQVMDHLGRVYALFREQAAGQKRALDPRPRLVVHRTPEPQEREGAGQARANAPARGSGEAAVQARTASGLDRTVAFHDFQRLLGWRKGSRSTRGGGREILSTDALISALSRLQESAGSEVNTRELRRRLSDDLQLGGGKLSNRALARTDEDTLELVFLLFEHALQGNHIPAPLKALIGRLKIPTLKVALVDKSFFEDKYHPARCLLNHLAQVAVGWNDDGDRSPGSVYDRIDGIVDRIVACDKPDPSVFTERDTELCDLLAKEQQAAQSQEVRAQEDLEQRERQHSTRQLVKMAINQRLRGHGPIPDSVTSLLYDGWQQVLLVAYLRDGAGGEQWQSAMRTMDRLVWSVQPKVADEERRELLRTIPELLRTLRESLAQVSYDQRRLARWFKELQALHIMALRGGESALTETGYQARPTTSRDQRPSSNLVKGSAVDRSPFNAAPLQVTGLRAGSWIELWREDGSLIRAKLAWRSPRSGIYLFVDRHGRNVLELAGEDILKLTQQGTLTVLGDAPIVDRAMKELVQTLRGNREI